jgi:hypothetical protein
MTPDTPAATESLVPCGPGECWQQAERNTLGEGSCFTMGLGDSCRGKPVSAQSAATENLTSDQIQKYRELWEKVSSPPWSMKEAMTAAEFAAASSTIGPQLLDAYEEADKTAQAYKLMNQTNHRARSELEAPLSESQQLLQAAVEVLDVAAKTLFDEVSAVSARPVWCWGRGSFQTTAATLGFYARCWLCKGEGIVDLRFYS